MVSERSASKQHRIFSPTNVQTLQRIEIIFIYEEHLIILGLCFNFIHFLDELPSETVGKLKT